VKSRSNQGVSELENGYFIGIHIFLVFFPQTAIELNLFIINNMYSQKEHIKYGCGGTCV
jgi:hypothetical protein